MRENVLGAFMPVNSLSVFNSKFTSKAWHGKKAWLHFT